MPRRPNAVQLPAEGVRACSWLCDELLLAVAEPTEEGANGVATRRTAKNASPAFRSLTLEVAGVGDEVLLMQLLVIRTPRIEASAMEARDLKTLLRDNLAGLDADSRAALLQFVLEASIALAIPASQELAMSLFELREGLRERLPLCELVKHHPLGVHVDLLLRLDERRFYMRGWCRAASGGVKRITVVSPEGARTEIADARFRFPRPDVEDFYNQGRGGEDLHGFIATFELGFPVSLSAGWAVEVESYDGHACETGVQQQVTDLAVTCEMLLEDLTYELAASDNLRRSHLRPALAFARASQNAAVHVEHVEQLGVAPSTPMVSVIVPLYRRVEFIEHQLAQFVHDDDFHRVDLIYVLDSPELADFLLPQARRLARLYQVPFRLAILNRNGGFSMANNLGATLARSRLLVLLNSDVLPDKPGWLGTMARFYDSKADIGALGVKLLYEDESLQHAGLYFVRPPGETVWFNEHYFKGLHRDFGPANEVRRVPAVTAACLMIASDLYSDVGGLQGHYIQGDYEDSDLCLRLSERGLTNWYLPSVELYHLEGQSYPTDARTRNASFNRWLHSVDWSDRISTVMSGLQDHGSENRALAQSRSALGLAPDRTDPPSPKREQTRKRTAS